MQTHQPPALPPYYPSRIPPSIIETLDHLSQVFSKETEGESFFDLQRTILLYFLSLLLMALLTFIPAEATQSKKQPSKRRRKDKTIITNQKQHQSSWDQIKNLLTCKQIEGSRVHDPSKNNGGYSKLGSCSSICSFRDVVHGNTRVVHRADNSPESSTVGQETGLLRRKPVSGSSSRSLTGSARSNGAGAYTSTRGMQLRKLSGCYECHMIVDPSRYAHYFFLFDNQSAILISTVLNCLLIIN